MMNLSFIQITNSKYPRHTPQTERLSRSLFQIPVPAGDVPKRRPKNGRYSFYWQKSSSLTAISAVTIPNTPESVMGHLGMEYQSWII